MVSLTKNQRKLIGLLICLVVVLVKPVIGRELTETEGWLLGTLYAAFVTGNFGEHLSQALKQRAATILPSIAQVIQEEDNETESVTGAVTDATEPGQ